MLDRRELFRAAGVLALPSTVGACDATGKSAIGIAVATNLGQLQAAPPTNGMMIYQGAIFHWQVGDHSRPPLGPVDDDKVVKQNDTPVTTGAWVRRFDSLSVRAFGAVHGLTASATANTAAFMRAIAAASLLGFPLHLEGGLYKLEADGAASGGVNFGRAGLRVKGDGATLCFEGTGRALVLDHGGRDGAFVEGLVIEDIVIIGMGDVTDGFYSRGVVRSAFRDIEVRNVRGKAFHIRHSVSCHYDSIKYSPSAHSPIFASHGIYIDNNGSGNYSTNCVFTNSVMENFPGVGCQLADATGLMFSGGTFEGCETGIIISASSDDNMFVKTWMEGNTAGDAVISGNSNGFVGAKFISTPSGLNLRILADASGTWFTGGGYIRAVHIAEGAIGTSFHQVGVDENLTGTIGFQGAGRFIRSDCRKIGASNAVTGVYDDIVGAVQSIGSSGTWNPTLVTTRGSIGQDTALTQGTFQRIGNLVFAQCFIYVQNVKSPSGEALINGLPFVSAHRQPGSIHATRLQSSAIGALQVRADPGSHSLSLSRLSAGRAMAMGEDIGTGTTLTVSITYTATS